MDKKEQEPSLTTPCSFFSWHFPKVGVIEPYEVVERQITACFMHVLLRFKLSPHLGKVAQLGNGTGLEIRQVDFYSRAGSNPVLLLLRI